MRGPLAIPELSAAEAAELDALYRTTRDARLRTRAQMVLLATEQRLAAPAIAAIVREHEETVRRWLKRWVAEGIEGLKDRPMPARAAKATPPTGSSCWPPCASGRAASASPTPWGRCNAWRTSWPS